MGLPHSYLLGLRLSSRSQTVEDNSINSSCQGQDVPLNKWYVCFMYLHKLE